MGLSLPIKFHLVCCHEARPKSLPQKQPNYKIKWAQNKIEHKREFFLLASGFLAPAGLLAYWLCFVCSLGGPSVFFFLIFSYIRFHHHLISADEKTTIPKPRILNSELNFVIFHWIFAWEEMACMRNHQSLISTFCMPCHANVYLDTPLHRSLSSPSTSTRHRQSVCQHPIIIHNLSGLIIKLNLIFFMNGKTP